MSNADPAGAAQPHHIALPAETDVDQSFDADGLYALRSTIAAHASHVAVTGAELDALVIIVGELAGNAVRHGGGTGRVRLWHDEHSVFLQIIDQGPGIGDALIGSTLPAAHQVGGRGLWIVRGLTQDLIIEPGPGGRGTCITAVVRRAGQPDPA